MSALVLLGHGSPDPAGRAELAELRGLVSRRLAREVALGVLEFPAPGLPSLGEVFAGVLSGQPVLAQPLLLFEGLHGRHDLPAVAADARRRLGLEVRLGTPFGREPALLELAAERLRAAGAGPGDLLLFVGRGSSQKLALVQTEEVARWLAGRLGLSLVVCYTGISRPDLAGGLEAALRLQPKRILALPYLLHTGILVRRVSQVLLPLAAAAGARLQVLSHIGNAPQLVELVAGRLESML